MRKKAGGRRRVATHFIGRVRLVGDGLGSCECFGCGTEVSLMERGWRDVGTAEVGKLEPGEPGYGAV